MAADLAVTPLREALEAAMQPQPPHAAARRVTVRAVHLGQAAALQAFLRFQKTRGCWDLLNSRRLTELVRLDSLLRALDTGLLPILIDDRSSPRAVDLLARYARHFKASAGEVGGSFANQVNVLADAITGYAKLPSRTRAKETEALGERIRRLRSSHLTIIHKPDDPDNAEPGSASDDDEAVDFDFDVNATTTLRKLLQAVVDNPGDARRVIVSGIKVCDAAPLRAVLGLEASARGWAVRGLGSLATIASVDACWQAVKSGFLDVLADDPPAALVLFTDFAVHLKGEAANSILLNHTITLCDYIIRHTNAANRLSAAEMEKSAMDLRRHLGNIRALYISTD